jgi:hypothetical protein
MKATDITKIIEANPQTIFSHTARRSYFMIEGFTYTKPSKYRGTTPTKVAITRSVIIRIDGNGEGTISIGTKTDNYTLTQIAGSVWNNPAEMCKAQVKSRIMEQATQDLRAKRHAEIAELSTNISLAFAHHQIETTWGTIRADSDHLTIKLTVEQAQALLNIIEG